MAVSVGKEQSFINREFKRNHQEIQGATCHMTDSGWFFSDPWQEVPCKTYYSSFLSFEFLLSVMLPKFTERTIIFI